MLLHKFRAAGHLAWLLLWANLRAVGRESERAPGGPPGASTRHGSLVAGGRRGALLRGKFRVSRIVKLCRPAESRARPSSGTLRPLSPWPSATSACRSSSGRWPLSRRTSRRPPHPKAAKCHGLRSLAHIWHGHYLETIDDLNRCAASPALRRGFRYLANLAQVHGIRGELEEARRAMAAQCGARRRTTRPSSSRSS